jgi:thioesterase III
LNKGKIMPHAVDIKIRGYHLDGYGHVNNARYLEFLEEARWSIFEQRIDLQAFIAKGYLFVVVNININYRRPAYLHEEVSVETALNSMTSHSGVFDQVVMLKDTDTVVADARITFVILDRRTHQPIKLEGEVAEILARLR